MALQLWYPDDIKRIAEALIAANADERFIYGIVTLAHALGADLRHVKLTKPFTKTELIEITSKF